MARSAQVARKTKETRIQVSLNLDGSGQCRVKTGIAFLDHMLTLMGVHGLFDLTVKAAGDLQIDLHHTNEDIGLVVGQAFDQALADRRGIRRVSTCFVPMDEALARVVLDISGRAKLVLRDARGRPAKAAWGSKSTAYSWGDAEHFLESFVRASKTTVHIDVLAGSDFHHTLEAVFKALGRALDDATRIDPRRKGVPSSKGKL